MNTTKTQLQKLACETSSLFEQKERDGGKTFWTIKDRSKEWLVNLCREAHGDMLPDDYKYEFIVEALDALSDYEDPDNIQEEIEADPYNSDRLKWLSSNLTRACYVEDAVKEYGVESKNFDLFNAIGWGQYQEKCEVLGIVRRYLEEKIEAEGK